MKFNPNNTYAEEFYYSPEAQRSMVKSWAKEQALKFVPTEYAKGITIVFSKKQNMFTGEEENVAYWKYSPTMLIKNLLKPPMASIGELKKLSRKLKNLKVKHKSKP